MNIYIIFLILFLCWFYSSQNISADRKRKNSIIAITLFLIFFSAFRNESVGPDTYRYIEHYVEIRKTNWGQLLSIFFDSYINPSNQVKDPLYSVIVKFFSGIFDNYRFFFFFYAAFLLGAIGKFVYKFTNSIKAVCFFYLFYCTFYYGYVPNCTIRQSIALGIIMIGYTLLVSENKIRKFIMLVILASFIHKSSLIVLLLLLISRVKSVKTIYILSLLLYPLMFVLNSYLGTFLTFLGDVYSDYLTTEFESTEKPFMVIVIMFCFYLYGLYVLLNDSDYIKNRIYYYGIIFTNMLVPFSINNPTILRICSFFGPLMALIIGNSFGKVRYGKLVYYILVAVFLTKALMSVDEYKFMWE